LIRFLLKCAAEKELNDTKYQSLLLFLLSVNKNTLGNIVSLLTGSSEWKSIISSKSYYFIQRN